MTDYHSPWKEALDAYFEPFMAFFFPDAHVDIDWTSGCEPLDKELQKIVREGELGRRFVDKLVKVWLKDGDEQWPLIHAEVQTDEEAGFPRRMYIYNYRISDKYNREVTFDGSSVLSIGSWICQRNLIARFGTKLDNTRSKNTCRS